MTTRKGFIKEQHSLKNINAREDNVKFMTKLISIQGDLCKKYNLEKKHRKQIKYIETKNRLNIQPRTFKRYG